MKYTIRVQLLYEEDFVDDGEFARVPRSLRENLRDGRARKIASKAGPSAKFATGPFARALAIFSELVVLLVLMTCVGQRKLIIFHDISSSY